MALPVRAYEIYGGKTATGEFKYLHRARSGIRVWVEFFATV